MRNASTRHESTTINQLALHEEVKESRKRMLECNCIIHIPNYDTGNTSAHQHLTMIRDKNYSAVSGNIEAKMYIN